MIVLRDVNKINVEMWIESHPRSVEPRIQGRIKALGRGCAKCKGGPDACPIRHSQFSTPHGLPFKAAGCGLGVSPLIFRCWIMTYWMAFRAGRLDLIRKYTISVILQSVTKRSVVAETARCFVSLNISISHSRSLKVIWNDTFETGA